MVAITNTERNGCHFSVSGWNGPPSVILPWLTQWSYFFQPSLACFAFLWQHFTPPSIVYPWFFPGPSLQSPGLAFVEHGGLYSSLFLSSKMVPYGRIFLKVSSVVNSLKPLLHEDSWFFCSGSQMREFCCFLGIASLVGISVRRCREAPLMKQGLNLWFPSRELPPPAVEEAWGRE